MNNNSMNQPPNTTEEKSVCCGAEKSSGFISRRIGKYYVGCLKCGEPFVPTPSVCEVAKGECTHRQGHEEDHNGNCYFCGLNMLTPTEPKKTVENVCCKLGGFEHKIGLEYKGKVCTCTCHTPIQTGNDEWEECPYKDKNGFCNIKECGYCSKNIRKEWNKLYGDDFDGGLRDKYFDFIQKAVEKVGREDAVVYDKAIKLAVLQERERITKAVEELEPKEIWADYRGGFDDCKQSVLDLLDNKQ